MTPPGEFGDLGQDPGVMLLACDIPDFEEPEHGSGGSVSCVINPHPDGPLDFPPHDVGEGGTPL